MGQVKQSKNGYNMYLGWYGKCGETDCDQKFDLKSVPEIASVYRFSSGTYESYNQGSADFMNAFLELECGNAYWIAMKPNAMENVIDIPDFVVSSNEVSATQDGIKPLIKQCSGDGTGTIDTTPTPKANIDPTPTPQMEAKKMKLPIILLGWDTGETDTSLHFTSNPLLMGGSTKRYATKQDVEDMFNGSQYTWPYAPEKAKPTGSAKEYYKAISFNQLDLEFEVLSAGSDPKPTSNNLNDYAYLIPEDYRKSGHGAGRSYNRLRSWLAQKVLPKVLQNLKENGRDFYKDFWAGVPLTIIQAGFSASSISNNRNDFIWAHKFQFTFNGRKQLYNINPFLGKMTGRGDLDRATISPVGVIVHETLHAFGLPDLYDTSYEGAGMNKISVMSSGSYGNSMSSTPYLPGYAISWSRAFLSNQKKLFETEIIEITESTSDIEVYPSNDVNKLYKIKHPSESDVWWVEYRTKESDGKVVNFDKLISENGLAIIHESSTGGHRTNKHKQPVHRRGESGYFISIEQRDGRYDTQHGSRNISNDLFRPGDEFSPYTVPSSISRTGVPSGIKVFNIRDTGNGSLLFDVEFTAEPSAKIIEVDYSWGNTGHPITSSKRAEWTESEAYGNLSATIKTENISNGTTLNMQINPGINSDVRFTGSVNNNECVINFTGTDLDRFTRELSKGVTNHFRFSVDAGGNHADAFPWIDFVVVRP
tara:strand:- start:24864 stop:26978 length:2115 start_codon:yes stop_codon:yes gene_type:complete